LNVAVEATVCFIVDQSIQMISRFSHKTPHQLDVKQLTKTSLLYREKTQQLTAYTINNNILLLSVNPSAGRQKESQLARAHALI